MDMRLRPATMDDASLLYHWRVEGESADWYEGPPTTREEHGEWLAARIDNPLVQIWIVEEGDCPLGVVRLDSNDELSVEIDPEWRHSGIGTTAIILACDEAKGRVKASVDASNEAAARAFEKAGFKRRPDVDFYLYRP